MCAPRILTSLLNKTVIIIICVTSIVSEDSIDTLSKIMIDTLDKKQLVLLMIDF